jgi:hypothetical protein
LSEQTLGTGPGAARMQSRREVLLRALAGMAADSPRAKQPRSKPTFPASNPDGTNSPSSVPLRNCLRCGCSASKAARPIFRRYAASPFF